MPKPFIKNDPRINRNGRPKKDYCLSQGLRDFLSLRDPASKQEFRSLLIKKIIGMAIGGDIAAIRLILSYAEGTPRPIHDWESVEEEKMTDAAIDERIQQALEEVRLDDEAKIKKITKMVLENSAPAELSEEAVRKQVSRIIVKA